MPAITIPSVTQPTPFTTIGRYDSPLAGATGQNTGQDIFQVFDTRGQIVTHMNSNGSIDPPLFPQNVITPISSAQLLALQTTPAVVLVSPGANVILIPQVVTLVYFYGGTAYTITGGDTFLYIGWGSNPTTDYACNDFFDTGFLDQTSSQLQADAVISGNVPLTSALGQPITLGIKDSLTLGNGTMSVTMSYQVLAVN